MEEPKIIFEKVKLEMKNKNFLDLNVDKYFIELEDALTKKKENKSFKKDNESTGLSDLENDIIEENKKEDDIYFEYSENKYLSVNYMFCLSVLKHEKKICKKIIRFKIRNNYKKEFWENKKNLIKAKLNLYIQNLEDRTLSKEDYFKVIKEELTTNQLLFNSIDNDNNVKNNEIREIKKRINKNIKLINIEIEKLIKELEKEKKTIPKYSYKELEILEILKERLKEYIKAVKYFDENKLPKNEAFEKSQKIIEAKKKIESNKLIEVNINPLLDPIKPEFINGCSNSERELKFKELINGLINQYQEGAKNLLEEAKKISQTEIKDLIKKTELEKCQNLIRSLKKDILNQWVRPPIFKKRIENYRFEKINYHIKENCIKISIGKLPDYNNNKNLYIDLKLELSKTYQENNVLFEKNIEWEMNESDYKNLYKKKLNVKLCRKNFFINSIEGNIDIDLSQFENNIHIEDKYKIDLVEKNEHPKINIKIQIRKPCNGKIYENKLITYYDVIKQYPQFNYSD